MSTAGTEHVSVPSRPPKALFIELLEGAGLLGAVAYCLILGYALLPENVCAFDDAYMFLRYADHIWLGKGFAWNLDGIQTYGVSSILYVLFVAAAYPFARFGLLSGENLLQLLSWLAGAGAFFLLARIITTEVKSPVFKSYRLILGLLFLSLFCGSVIFFNATSGMDTMLALFTNVMLIGATLRALREPFRQRGRLYPNLALLAGAAYITVAARPDNLLYAILFPTLALILLAPRRPDVRAVLIFGAYVSVLFGLDLCGKLLVFGHVLPLTYYAKQSTYYEGYSGAWKWDAIAHQCEFLVCVAPFIFMIFLGAGRSSLAKITVFLLPVLITAIFLSTRVIEIMGMQARFYLPAWPFLATLGILLVADAPKQTISLKRIVVSFLALLALLIGWHSLPRKPFTRPAEASLAGYLLVRQADLPALGWWKAIAAMEQLVATLPGGATVAMSEHGLIGAKFPNLTIIDLVGLHDPTLARGGFSVDYVLDRKPVLIWLPHAEYGGLRTAFFSSPRFWREYTFYADAFDYGVAIRQGASDDLISLQSALDRQWKVLYNGFEQESFRAMPKEDVRFG